MPHVCPQCGEYALHAHKQNDHTIPGQMLCTHCGQTTSSNIFPLFVITGTSGAGKTTILPELRKQLPECVIFDKDLLLASFNEHFYTNWLLIAHSIAQGGRHTIICGTIMPEDFENSPERGLVGTIHFLNLHCDDETRAQRLLARPPWRQASQAFIDEHQRFARWLLDNAATSFDPPMPTVDTSTTSVTEAAQQIAHWVLSILDGRPTRAPSNFY